MKLKFLRLAIISLFLFSANTALFAQRMSDTQVEEYVQEAMEQGKDQQTIMQELMKKGVSRDQAMRVKDKMMEEHDNGNSPLRNKKKNSKKRMLNKPNGWTEDLDMQDEYSDKEEYEEDDDFFDLNAEMKRKKKEKERENEIFGHNIFKSKQLNFIPDLNLATPDNYILGPNDEVIIEIWGSSQNTIHQPISPDGYINIPNLGPIYLANKSIKEADKLLKQELRKIYSDSGSKFKISLGNIRTIKVNVMGEVTAPGTYTLSSFSTIFHALYSAKGINPIGSLRNVQVAREGKIVAKLDVYDYIMNGNIEENICLREGDVVIVPPYEALAKITGRIKRPMRYEMKENESLATLLDYAGGFKPDAYKKVLNVIRRNASEYSVATVREKDYQNFMMADGDSINVDTILNRYTNKLELKGAVYHPGTYELCEGISTVKELVETADGILPDAFTGRAVLYRERPNLTREVLSVDIDGILKGTSPDVKLRKSDVLYIPSIHDLKELGIVKIFGEVYEPGEYPYSDNMSLEDLVITAGGLKEAASVVRVDISRRIKNPKGTEVSDSIGQSFSFALKDGFVVDGTPGFVLQPYDQIFVRRSPSFNELVNVRIDGEVTYSGNYTLKKKSERLSELIHRAGGITKFGYVRGAKLTRKANDEEIARMKDVMEMLNKEMAKQENKKDSVNRINFKVDSTFTVGLNLEEALKHPGGDADIVLREGDIVNIPEYNNTVKISGEVMVPNTVSYIKGKNVRYYLGQAGGYANFADRRHKYIIYMNGQIAKVKSRNSNIIEPGSEIVVPHKDKKFKFTDFMSGASSIVSMATMIVAMLSFIK